MKTLLWFVGSVLILAFSWHFVVTVYPEQTQLGFLLVACIACFGFGAWLQKQNNETELRKKFTYSLPEDPPFSYACCCLRTAAEFLTDQKVESRILRDVYKAEGVLRRLQAHLQNQNPLKYKTPDNWTDEDIDRFVEMTFKDRKNNPHS